MKKHMFAVCAYKESPYLEKCILSLSHQSVKSNIIIVTSTPCEYIESIAKKYSIPYYINPGEGGITQDWNYAYQCADSQYITIAHQDDIYGKDYLKNVLMYIENAKRPLIFFSDYYEIREGKKVFSNRLLRIKRVMLVPLKFRGFQKSVWIRRRILSMGSPICCPSVTYCAGNLPSVVFKNHFRSCEDWEAWEMISKMDGEFLYCPKLLVGHRIHKDSETSSIIGDNKRTGEEYEMFCKFWPQFIARLLIKPYSLSQKSNDISKDE